MSLEAALVAFLTADPDVQQIAAGRVYPMEIPQGASLPAVRYYKVGHTSTHSLAGLSGLSRARMTVDCLAVNYTEAKALAQAIRGTRNQPKLDGFRGKLAGVMIHAAFCTNEVDLMDPPVHGDESGVKHTALDFDVTFEDLDASEFEDTQPYADPL